MIKNKLGLKHVLTRMDVAMDVHSPQQAAGVRLDLLPQRIEHPDGTHEILPPGHRLYLLWDGTANGRTLLYLVEVIAPHSPSRQATNLRSLVEACDQHGVDMAPARIGHRDSTPLFRRDWLSALLRDQLQKEQQSAAEGAREAGASRNDVEGIATGWPRGKLGLTWRDCVEPLTAGDLLYVSVAVFAVSGVSP
jgi:hypothetical protein